MSNIRPRKSSDLTAFARAYTGPPDGVTAEVVCGYLAALLAWAYRTGRSWVWGLSLSEASVGLSPTSKYEDQSSRDLLVDMVTSPLVQHVDDVEEER